MDPLEAPILLIEDDALTRNALSRLLRRDVQVMSVGTLAEARSVFPSRPWSGYLVDVALPDGSGLDWLAEVRDEGAVAPALVVTAHCTQAFVNRAFSLRASYLCKPFPPADVLSFVQTATRDRFVLTAIRDGRSRSRSLTDAVAEMALRHSLTAKEREILWAAFHGISAKEFVADRGVSINTYKSQVRKLLRKLRATTLGEVRDAVLRALSS